ncbi:F-box/LRR-repeat protein At4g14096-like [Herrania umbratica]|uniref:F-box/LRR-repeat protein At4g14096-like n=1 Tax=Herrania umbratica TaxID=108875 RepID=A0A6J1AJK7_9ROSI|nr:F-box/LRR-repeat protein At4g14096-like [Herrania umbratica]
MYSIKVQQDDSSEDFISQLPNELLRHILSFLPTKDIVSTSALSSRWRSLWTSFAIVNFNFDAWKEKQKERPSFLDKVQRELLIPDTTRIRKFHLHSDCAVCFSQILASMSIVSEVVNHKVEELDLSIPYHLESNLFTFPHCLFTSQTLISLKLHMTQVTLINFPTSIFLPRLKTLYLDYIKFQDEHSAQLLLSACPVLKELCIDNCGWTKTTEITISIPTLLTLSLIFFDENPPDISIKICTPNLLNFYHTSSLQVELITCNLSSVTRAEVDVFGSLGYDQRVRAQAAHRTLQLLKAIRGVKFLELSYETLQGISFAENFQANHLPTFYNLTDLNVNFNFANRDGAALMHVLQKSPNLRSLHFPQGFDEEYQKNVIPVKDNAEEVRFLNIYTRMLRLWSGFQSIVQKIYQKTWERRRR